MRLAYIISSYKRPDQLARLVRRLAVEGASFAVHVDRKASDDTFEAMVAGVADVPDVAFVPRHVCHWGGFGHVRASLEGMASLLERRVRFDYAILLTAQDYPLVPTASIERFLEQAGGRSYLNHWLLPHAPWSGRGGLDRVESWHLVASRRLHLRIPLRRRLPGGLEPYGGSSYWCLSHPLVQYVHDFVAENPRLVRFFEHVYIPDELFFQTVIMNSPERHTVVDDNLRYIDWTSVPAPTVLTTLDLPRVLDSGKLFARKFDTSVDARVLDVLDDHIDRVLAPSP